MTLELPHDLAGQSVELHQCIVCPLHQREEVPEYCNRPGVRCVDLVLGAENGGPDLVQPFRVHLFQAFSDRRVVSSKQLLNAEVLVGTSLGHSFNRPLLRQKVVFPTDVLPLFNMGDGTLPEPQLHPYRTRHPIHHPQRITERITALGIHLQVVHEEQVRNWGTQVRHQHSTGRPEGMGYGRNAQAKQEG